MEGLRMTINTANLDKALVLIALYNNSKPQGMGFFSVTSEPLTVDGANEALISQGYYPDYINGRVIKADLRGDEFDPRLYDRDNGEGSAERALREHNLIV